jgi:hypothetical protein
MKPSEKLQPFLRCKNPEFALHLGATLIPITSPVPASFDGEEYGILSTFTIDGSKLTADQTLALACWIAQDTQGSMSELLQDIQSGKCLLPEGDQYEVVWREDGAQFWG